MDNNMQFYDKLSESAKTNYDKVEEMKPHTDKFKELMNRETRANNYLYFTTEEQDYLGQEDLVTFADLFAGDAQMYMDNN